RSRGTVGRVGGRLLGRRLDRAGDLQMSGEGRGAALLIEAEVLDQLLGLGRGRRGARHRGVVGGGIRRTRALPLHVVAVGLGGRSRGARQSAGAAAAGRTGRGGHVAGRCRSGDGVQAGGGIISLLLLLLLLLRL